MRYYLLVTDFINSSVDDVCTTVPPLAVKVEWIDMNALSALGRYRTALENQVALLSQQMSGFSAADDLFYGPDFEICLPPVSAGDFRQLFDSSDAAVQENSTDPTESFCSFWFFSGQPEPEGAGFWRAPVQPTVRIVRGHCQHCWFQGGLFSKDVALGCVSLVSTWCPVCGMPAEPGRSAYVVPTFDAPLVLLTQIALLEDLSRFEILLLLVIAAVAVLLSRLRRAIIRNEIAIRQRSFFTHHGAHPPRIQPLQAAGLLSGMAFQLQVAV